ncbi:MAG: hypothetical protein RL238_3134 [Actinomycetota bacterium]|jgi:hypothetical protein
MPTRAGSLSDLRDRAATDAAGHPGDWLRLLHGDALPPDVPLLVLVHDGPRPPRGIEALGCAVACLDPSVHAHDTVEELTTRTRDSVSWLVDHPGLGHDADRVVVVGHGTGAHLAAMVAVHDARPAGYALVSGRYDLTDDGRLDLQHVSPLHLLGASDAECVVAWASDDTCTVRRQGQAWAATWSITEWNRPATAVEATGRSHTDIVDDLFDPDTMLGAAVLAMLSRIRTT